MPRRMKMTKRANPKLTEQLKPNIPSMEEAMKAQTQAAVSIAKLSKVATSGFRIDLGSFHYRWCQCSECRGERIHDNNKQPSRDRDRE
jgi:hypothetical protein